MSLADSHLEASKSGSAGSFEGSLSGRRWSFWLGVPYVLLLAGLIVTGIASYSLKSDVDRAMADQFELIANEVTSQIQERLILHGQILRSCAAFYEETKDIDRKKWGQFAERISADSYDNGLQNIGFIMLVPREKLTEHVQSIRADGFPAYRVWPEGDRPRYAPVVYKTPFQGSNLAAFGFDLLSEPTRQSAMEKACDSNAAILSDKINLVADGSFGQSGVMLLIPVYRSGAPHATVAERRAAIVGWVNIPYYLRDFLSGVLGERDLNLLSPMRLQIFGDKKMTPQTLLFDSKPPGDSKTVCRKGNCIRFNREMMLHGQVWSLVFSRPAIGFFSTEYAKAWFVLVGGVAVSLLLAGLFAALSNTRWRARQLARQLNMDLHRANDRLELATRIAGLGIWDYNLVLGKVQWDRRMFQFYGIRPADFDGTIGYWYSRLHPDDQLRCKQEVDAFAAGKDQEFCQEFRVVRPAGDIRYLQSLAHARRNLQGELVEAFGINRDITESKEFEDNLARERTFLSNLLDSIPDIVFFKDFEGRYLGCNPPFSEFAGKDRKEIVGRTDYELFGPDVAEGFRKYDMIVMQSRQISRNEEWITYHDGRRELIETLKAPLMASDGRLLGLLGISRCITERKLAEEQLQKSRWRLKSVIDATGLGVWEWNVQTGESVYDEMWTKIIGYTLEELMPLSYENWVRLIHPDDVALAEAKVREVVDDLKPGYECEYRVRHKDGRWIWINDRGGVFVRDENGKPLVLLGTYQDITARKEAGVQLQKSQWRLKNVTDATGLGVWEWNVKTDEVILDELWVKMIGYTLAELSPICYDTWKHLVHPDDFPEANRLLQQVAAGEKTAFVNQYRMKHKNGQWVWISDQGSVFEYDKDGKPLLLVGSHQDITARKHAEALQAYNREFEHLIASLSNRFINVALDDIDTVINETLQSIGEFVCADRGYIFEFYDNMQMISNTYEWCIEGVESQIGRLPQMPTNELPWFMRQISRDAVIIRSIDELPEEAKVERRLMIEQSIQSLVLVPLSADTVRMGFIGFEAVRVQREWSNETVAVLKIAAGIITNMLLRKRGEELIQKELDLALELNASRSLSDILAICLKAALDISGMDSGGIYLMEPDYSKIKLVQHVNFPPEAVAAGVFTPETPQYQLMMKGHNVYSSYLHPEADVALCLRHADFKAIAVLPVIYQGSVVACLKVASRVASQIPEFSRKVLESVLPHIGFAIVHSRHEEDIRTANKNLQNLFDTVDDLMFIYDTDGKILHTNPVAQKRLGYTANELKLMSAVQIHPPDRAKEVETVLKNMVAHKCNTCVVPLLTKFGEIIPIETVVTYGRWNDIPVLFGICRDISERLRSEAALRESALQKQVSENLRSIIDNIPGTVYRISADGNISFFSPHDKMSQALVVDPAKQMTLIHPDDRRVLEQALADLRQRKTSLVLIYRVMTAADQPVRYVEDRCNSIFDEDGKYLGIDGIRLDITERVRAEEERAQLESVVRKRQRLETIGTLAGGIAHDFNNILVPVLGYAEMGMAETNTDQPLHDYFERIMSAAERAKNLVAQILTFNRPGESAPKPVSLPELLNEVLHLLRPSIPANIDIKLLINENCRNILADLSQIHQMIVNLCTNAFQAMEDKGGNGVLTIALSEVTDSPLCPRSCVPGKTYLMLQVSDSGIGMDETTMEHIYEPFFTTKPVNKGTGLGLAVVYGVVKSCKGDIAVESTPGQGATFRVFLPVIDENVEERSADTLIKPGGGRVLLVDDERSTVEVFGAMLTKIGYLVTGKTSSAEALAAVVHQPGEFDLVISDLTMPELSGIELAGKIHALEPKLPIVLVTGYGKNIDLPDEPNRFGIRQILKKPVKFELLAATVAELINHGEAKK